MKNANKFIKINDEPELEYRGKHNFEELSNWLKSGAFVQLCKTHLGNKESS